MSEEDRAVALAVIEEWITEAEKAYGGLYPLLHERRELQPLGGMLYCLMMAQRSMLDLLTREGGARR